jgi:hypothetical protein
MSIDVTCPNGHALKIKDKYAGKIGRCPHCQMPVHVPEAPHALTDDEILNVVGPPDDIHDMPVHQEYAHLAGSESGLSLLGGSSVHKRLTKTCPKCKYEVKMKLDICPHCHMYFSDPTEVVRRMVVVCRTCGTETDSTFHRCVNCGADLPKY